MLETAITLATNARDAHRDSLCLKWLPLKLDAASRAIYKQIDRALTWTEMKAELKKLLIDPQEAYKWQAKRSTIKWDGKESFHALASRIITAVAKYDPDLPDAARQKEHFFRFREALPREYQNAIDMGCGPTERTLEFAKDLAQRTKMTQEYDDKAVTFAGAGLEESRTSSLELALARIDSKLENMNSTIETRFKSQDERIGKLEKAIYGREPSQDRSRARSRGFSSQGNYRSPSPYQSRGNSPYGYSSRQQSPTDSQARGSNSSYAGQRYQNQPQYQPQYQGQNQYRSNYRDQSPRRGPSNSNYRDQSPRRGPSNSNWRSNQNRSQQRGGFRSPQRGNNQPQTDRQPRREEYRAIDTDDERSGEEDDTQMNMMNMTLGNLINSMGKFQLQPRGQDMGN